MIVTQLVVYPIKSCRGIALDAAVVTRRGLARDRLWMVADDTGKLLSQRNEPGLRRVTTRFEGELIVASAPGVGDLAVPTSVAGPRIDVEVWKYRGPVVVHEAGSAWFSAALGRRASLLHMPDDVERRLDPRYGRPGDAVSFADGYPVHLTTEESLADASIQAGQPLEMARFRPNVVVRGAPSPYDEDGWRRVTLGASPLRLAKRCDRCVMTTIDPASGERGPEPLRAFARYREDGGSVYFGVYLVPEAPGRAVRVGDPVSVLERP
jgi:uncharacterized protein YcbX